MAAQMCVETIANLRKFLANPNHKPVFGICLGMSRMSWASRT
jgi:hypothetical protein